MSGAFEVISLSSRSRDRRWKKLGFDALPSLCTHVVLAQDDVDMRGYDRASGWQERRATGSPAAIELEELGIKLTPRLLYRGTRSM